MEYLITWTKLHHRLGCVSPGVAKQLAEKELVPGVHVDTSLGNMVFCESCIYTKATWKPVVKVQEEEWAAELRGKVHTDLWGSARVATIKGCRYYITFTDGKTWFSHLYLLKHKSDTLCAYKEYKASLII